MLISLRRGFGREKGLEEIWERVDLGARDANESCGLENRGFERRRGKVGFETGNLKIPEEKS